MEEKEYILCASIEIPINDKIEPLIVSGYRHSDCMKVLYMMGNETYITQNMQGFLTSKGRFVSRSEAMIIAKEANQVSNDMNSTVLISEDLY